MSRPRAPRPPALRYRPARRTDVDTLADLALRAYRVSSLEARREFYTDHPRFTLKDVRAGELDGEIVASLVFYPLTALVRGVRVPLTGIGSVAVSPEHRRRGVAEALIRSALRELRQRGDLFSVLYPFRSEFYRRFGYGIIEKPRMLSVSPSLLPASDESRRVRRMRLPDRPHVQALYDQHTEERGHFALARRPEWWERRLWGYDGDWVVYERHRGHIDGYLQYQVDNAEGPWKLAITVNEMVAMTPAAQRGLWGYLHALRDQAAEIVFAAPDDGVLDGVLADAENLRGELKLGVLRSAGHAGSGAMLRLLDAKAALEAVPLDPHARGELTIELRDELLPQNARGWRVTAREGRMQVRVESARMQGTRQQLPRFVTPPDVLASVLAGALSPVRAVETGLAEEARGGAALMDRWFAARPAFLHPFNAF